MFMNMVLVLPAAALLGIVLNLVFYRFRRVRAVLSTLIFLGLFALTFALRELIGVQVTTGFSFLGQELGFTLTPLGFYFLLMINGITLLTSVFSLQSLKGKSRHEGYYLWLFLKTFGMTGVVLASDFLTLFILWEVMTWSTFFLMQQTGGRSRAPAFKYLVYAIASSMMLLLAIAAVYTQFGTFAYGPIAAGFSGLPLGMLVFLSVVLVGAFAVEAAVYPFHGWVPESYASTFTSLTSYLSGISTRMGVYGIILVVFGFIGSASMERMNPMGVLNFRYLFAVLSVLTMIVPTYTALFQHDAKRLVTWHGIGQGGYMLVGIISGTVLGIAGGLFHIFNHLTYVTLILFSLAAVEYRTGTMNLNKLGGLIKKQPVAFLGLLFGIIGLAGIPPMNGFVSKWFIYKGLIDNGMPFLALAAVIGTLGTILSVYKLIHNVFLGQLPEKYNQVREVPLFMQLPIWILMLTVFGTGVFPGPVLAVVAEIQEFFGQAAVPYSMTGIAPEAGSLNMFVINLVFMGSLAAAWLVYLAGGRRKHVGQYDNYAAGHFLDASVPYNFNYRFYTGFEHILKPENKRFAARFEGFFSGLTEFAGDYLRKLYSGNVSTYTKYILLSVVILVLVLGAMI